MKGFVRWFDKMGGDGILTRLETGNEYYFNSWSLPRTVYVVTGNCKKTGRKKTVKTQHYPGMWLSYKVKQDPTVEKLQNYTPVRFKQAKGIDQRWAVEISIDKSLAPEVHEHRLICILDSMLACDIGDERFPNIWRPHAVESLERLLAGGES